MIGRFWSRRTVPWTERTIWALDLEATGLDPERDAILSVGMVPIRGGRVQYGERWYELVRPPTDSPVALEALRIHHILPEEARHARPIEDVLDAILSHLDGAVLLVHHARLDVGLLKNACRRLERRWPEPRVVDTMHLLSKASRRRRMLEPHAEAYPAGLADARRELELPVHTAHHALADALATAELFLALQHRLDARGL